MTYQTERLSGNQQKILFTVTAEEFDAAMQKAYLKTRGRINVPGFRKGKAPRRLIENMYGEGVFYDEAFDIIFPDLYQNAVEEADLFPVDQPQVEIEQIGSGQELKFHATVYVKPEVALGNYKGFKATRHLHPISQEEIDHRISHDTQKVTTQEDLGERALEDGDTATIDYLGKVEGIPFDGGAGQGHPLKLGSASFIPGFEEQLIGLKAGEEKEITVTFPEQYHSEELAGKEAQFDVKIISATREVKPELDDDFAQDVSEHQTFEAYRAAIVQELESRRDKQAEDALEDNLVQQAVDAADCDIPDSMVERATDRHLQNMQLQMMYQGIRFEDYLMYTNQTVEDVRAQMRQEALNAVKTELVIEAIAKAEALEPDQALVDEEIARRAKDMGREPEAYKSSLSEQQLDNFKELAKNRMVVELIKVEADIDLHEGEHEDPIDAGQILDQVSKALDDQEAKEEVQAEEGKAPAKAKKTKKTKEDQPEEG